MIGAPEPVVVAGFVVLVGPLVATLGRTRVLLGP